MQNNQVPLKPCLVIGTGFHQWVLGDSLVNDFKELVSWHSLILEVARRLGVALDKPVANANLALTWEGLLNNAKSNGFNLSLKENAQINEYEGMAQEAASKILTAFGEHYPVHSRSASFPLSGDWGAVVSLNFDSHWAGERISNDAEKRDNSCRVDVSKSTKQCETHRLNYCQEYVTEAGPKVRVWFPNGWVRKPSSMRLGFREFGFQSVAIAKAFDAIKIFERQCGEYEAYAPYLKTILDDEGVSSSSFKASFPLTWVAEMIYRPVVFAGVGMSDAEVGLWWIMVQRARNLANVDPALRPKAYILLRHDDPRLEFWETNPCGIEPVVCKTWEEGWSMIRALKMYELP